MDPSYPSILAGLEVELGLLFLFVIIIAVGFLAIAAEQQSQRDKPVEQIRREGQEASQRIDRLSDEYLDDVRRGRR